VESKRITGPHEELTYRIIGAAMAVHRRLGPGYREVIYQSALEEELSKAGIPFEAEKSLPVCDGERLLGYYIPDFIVDDKVIVEIKAFATVHQKYLGQVITYLNHTGLPVGLLINFGERSLRPRRVFPSPQTTELAQSHQWLFVPDKLKVG
jgi:GxxExxY protein